jgi:hypothetical protein
MRANVCFVGWKVVTDMSAPRPKDPLDELITQFRAAVEHFLAKEEIRVEPPTLPSTQNPLVDIVRNWERIKRHFGRVHEAMVGAEPEARERLQKIVNLGSDALTLTDDPYIVGPVDALVRMAADEQTDIGSMVTRLGQTTSVPGFLALLAAAAGFAPRNEARRKAISAALDSLTAYYLLNMPPRDPA